MPDYVVQRADDVLNDIGRSMRGSRILLIGVAYKPNIGDVRESPAIEVADRLLSRGALVRYVDPHVPSLPVRGGTSLSAVELTAAELDASDLVVITTAHAAIDWALIRERARSSSTRAVCAATVEPAGTRCSVSGSRSAPEDASVRCSPSSSPTRAVQPSRSVARAADGTRRRVSSKPAPKCCS